MGGLVNAEDTPSKVIIEEALQASTTRPIAKLDDDHRRAIIDDFKANTELKKLYARWFIGILIGQLVVMNGIFIGVGLSFLHLHDSTLNIYMSGTLAEVFGVVVIITKYLFAKTR